MAIAVYDFDNYREFVETKIKSLPSGGHGVRSRLAEALRCHPGYITQVMSGSADFSIEQAALINDFFKHNDEEGDFFILLVQLARAGNESLRQYCKKRIGQIRKGRAVLKNRLTYQRVLSIEEQVRYYSAWYYAAIHMAPGIPSLDTAPRIAEHLNLPLSVVTPALDFLVSIGLLTEKKGRYGIGTGKIHLGNDSGLITRHHTNWRIEAIKALDRESINELHYSSLVTMGREDVPKAREVLAKAIEDIRAIVRPSPNEEMICYTLDLFGIKS